MTIDYISHEVANVREHQQLHGFCVHDRKSRELGALITYRKVTYAPGPKISPAKTLKDGYKLPEYRSGSTTVQPGEYFAWVGMATRRGEPYGPLQTTHLCATAEQRDAEVAKYLRAAKQRAIKRAQTESAKVLAAMAKATGSEA
jgi:hypothetical protein